MSCESEIHVTLAIDAVSEPITGWIQGATGSRRAFIGILELIALLEGVRETGGVEGLARGSDLH